ncbi:hypothetical protein FACS1894122_02550 [Alphaproteobacteria bacterium]|nr:hypothetical protein FACS1894122_02550 [Alphaproteobacteria bacterium]
MGITKFFVSIICCFACIEVIGGNMNLPTIAFSKKEGVALSAYHKQMADPAMGFKYFMPRSKNELLSLYNLYISGEIKSRRGVPVAEALWGNIVDNVDAEFSFRCEDNDKSIIDDYLSYFSDFIKIVDEFHDQSFLEVLHHRGRCNLGKSLALFVISSEDYLEESNLAREFTYLPYMVSEIDKILNASRSFQDIKLAEFYRTHYLTDEFRNSPKYQEMYNAIAKTFEKGVSLAGFLPKK